MRLKNKKCALCGKNSSVISELLAVCYECITSRFELSRQYIINSPAENLIYHLPEFRIPTEYSAKFVCITAV